MRLLAILGRVSRLLSWELGLILWWVSGLRLLIPLLHRRLPRHWRLTGHGHWGLSHLLTHHRLHWLSRHWGLAWHWGLSGHLLSWHWGLTRH